MEKIKIRGLLKISSALFGAWGAAVVVKGFYDRFLGGEPEANKYAPASWAFVSREQWARYASFELFYGLACVALAVALLRYARFLPETLSRPRSTEPTLID